MDKLPTKQEMIETLRNKYYEELEERGIEFLDKNDLGEGYSEFIVKEEFLTATPEDMIDFIYGDDPIGQWALLNIKENK